MSTIGDFASSVLQALGAPATSANVQSIEDWAAQEGGGGANNPLNTTLQTAGSTGSINSVGVQNYASTGDGVQATVQTLEGGNYSAIVSALKSGAGLIGAGGSVGSELSTWSGGGYDSLGGVSEGSSAAVAGGSGATAGGANAVETVAGGTSGNPLVDSMEWAGNLLQLTPLAGITSTLKDGVNALAAVNHEIAYVFDEGLAMFKPGQGWRLVFTGATAGVGFAAFRAYREGGQGGGDHLPMAISLTGVALLTGFMAFRPWPVATGKPVKPGAYAYQILEGQTPAAGPPAVSPAEVQTTEFAIGTVAGIWAITKLSATVKNIAQAVYDGLAGLSGLGNIIGGGGEGGGGAAGEGGGEEAPPAEPVEPIEPILPELP